MHGELDQEETVIASEPPVFVTDRSTDPGIQIAVVRERAESVTIHPNKWRAFEVWTKNRVYGLDQSLLCIEVLDRRTGKVDPESKVLGYRFGGGRLRENSGVRYAYPFPLAGMEGMLGKGQRQVFTSRIERFVIRIRDLRARGDIKFASWEDVVNRGESAE
jgi:hypothetical protein